MCNYVIVKILSSSFLRTAKRISAILDIKHSQIKLIQRKAMSKGKINGNQNGAGIQ